ncbi:anaerobic C4-dicarboxylate transporter [Nitrosospira sp. Nsp1]|uniref:anaerobic C4-dicarboxylate transporter n=1 Tax=Nitrosospira sp. Nsp1 TaxID=136547 RepID=UPI00088973AE|nr:anaerobic C4-dicarboxylate transporter [Nitrosospira sp. Nsp1]SCX46101.1 anaerobic C4-dicarboxylate transporter DcuB [Nitrosospira sp. Nsp1]
MSSTDFLLELAIILACLVYGTRKGGVALGLLSGIGLVILVFVFRLSPGKPPVDVILTIIAVVAASATLQASGGLEVVLRGVEKLLRRNPKFISVLAPFTTCGLTMVCGTGHVVYTMLPIIYDVAIRNGIRPERPMAASAVASQMGIVASPVSVAMVSLATFLAAIPVEGAAIDFITVLSITIPSTLVGVLIVSIFSGFRSKELDDDKRFQAYIADPDNWKRVYGETAPLEKKQLLPGQWIAMGIFIGAIMVVSMLGAIESLRPVVDGKPLSMVITIQIFMLLAGALIILFTETDPAAIARNDVFRAGMVAVVAVFGVAWMANTVFEANLEDVKIALSGLVEAQPWTYAIALLMVSRLVNSQAAAITAMVPLALSIGVAPGYVIAFAAASYGYFILPTYPSDLAAIQFDLSGTAYRQIPAR